MDPVRADRFASDSEMIKPMIEMASATSFEPEENDRYKWFERQGPTNAPFSMRGALSLRDLVPESTNTMDQEWMACDDEEVKANWELVKTDIDSFCRKEKAKQAQLTRDEILALRAYTGPGYSCINQALRSEDFTSFPKTIYNICTGVAKLVKVSKVEVVFRGVRGRLPRHLQGFYSSMIFSADSREEDCLKPSALPTYGSGGGYELGFMSTTRDPEVARSFAADGTSTLMRMVTKGADLGWLSQFPSEDELLLPPGTLLQIRPEGNVLSGKAAIVHERVNYECYGDRVLWVGLDARLHQDCGLTCYTIEPIFANDL
eukprot:m.293028 g.293028  ORF g.293028 m.293028 type:complete len:317 (+) comp18064_c0_seq1:2-952(+)